MGGVYSGGGAAVGGGVSAPDFTTIGLMGSGADGASSINGGNVYLTSNGTVRARCKYGDWTFARDIGELSYGAKDRGSFGSFVSATLSNTWYSLVNVSGKRGALYYVFPQIAHATNGVTIDIEVTIDGVVHVYSGHSENRYISDTNTIVLGQLLSLGRNAPLTTAPTTILQLARDKGLNSKILTTSDDGHYNNQFSKSFGVPTPEQAKMLGLDCLRFNDSMQVRVRHTGVVNDSVYVYGQFASCSYLLE